MIWYLWVRNWGGREGGMPYRERLRRISSSKYSLRIRSVKSRHSGDEVRLSVDQVLGWRFALIESEMPLSWGPIIYDCIVLATKLLDALDIIPGRRYPSRPIGAHEFGVRRSMLSLPYIHCLPRCMRTLRFYQSTGYSLSDVPWDYDSLKYILSELIKCPDGLDIYTSDHDAASSFQPAYAKRNPNARINFTVFKNDV